MMKNQASTSGDLEYEDLEVGLHHSFGIMDQSARGFKVRMKARKVSRKKYAEFRAPLILNLVQRIP